ncbi:MAG: ABC transporter permease [Candidatus Brocadiia bacterium]
MGNIFSWIGRLTLSSFGYFYSILAQTYLVIRTAWLEKRHQKPFPAQNTALQVYFTGVQALGIIILAGLVVGAAVIVELSTILPTFGAGKYVERLSVITLIRELIPIITALIIIGRSGTAMASELGTMRLNREIDLLESLGINIDYHLLLPRIMGTVIATVALTVIFNAVALGGGFVIARFVASGSHSFIFGKLLAAVNFDDVMISLAKSLVFGWVIAVVNCNQGLSVRKSFTEVPQATTRGVVNSIIICFVLSIFISLYIFPEFSI